MKEGTSYHCVVVEYMDGTREEIVVPDKLGEDCNAYETKNDIINHESEKDPIRSIKIVFMKDVVKEA